MKAPGRATLVGPRWFRYGALKGALLVWRERGMGFECDVAAGRGVEAWLRRTDGERPRRVWTTESGLQAEEGRARQSMGAVQRRLGPVFEYPTIRK
jgi:hypothetical protein